MNRVARILMSCAAWLLRNERPEWARAMRAEFMHLPTETSSLRWAAGCAVAAVHERVNPMNAGSLRVSRWIMLVEALGLFGPATLAWFLFTRALLGLDGTTIGRDFLADPEGKYIFTTWIVGTVAGLLGPIGLFLGLRFSLVGSALRNRKVGYALIAVPILAAVANFVAYLVFQPAEPLTNYSLALMYWLLPLIGIVHLMFLGKPLANGPAAAATA